MSWLEGFVVTYLLHSTLLLGGCWLLTRYVRLRLSVQDAVWKACLVGGVITAALSSGGVMRPLWEVRLPASSIASEAVEQNEPRVAEDAASPRPGLAEGAPPMTPSPAAPPSDRPSVATVTPTVAWSWRTGAASAWLLISGMMLVMWLERRRRLFTMLGRRDVVRDGTLQMRFEEFCERGGLRGTRLTESATCPLPLALTTAEVCVPARFVAELDVEQQEGALAHEVAHLARRDPAWLLVTQIVTAVFFFQPLNFVARRKLRAIAESLCDDWAARQGRGLGLARCLAEVATWLQPEAARTLSAVSAMASERSGLLQRVERLLRDDVTGERPAGRVLVSLVVTAVVVAAMLAPSLQAAPMAGMEILPRGVLPGAQDGVFRAPDGRAPLAERLAWARTQAESRGRAGYWVAYAVRRELEPGTWYMSDSEGISIRGNGRTDNPIEAQLGRDPSFSDGTIVVLARHEGDGSIVRLGHRSMAAPMEWDGRPVFWLGTAADDESLAHLTSMMERVPQVTLQAELVDAIALHATTSLVLPVLRRILADHPSADVRGEAAEGTEYHPVAESLQLAVQTARTDASVEVRAEAAEAIGMMPIAGAADALVELAVRSGDAPVRAEAAEALGELRTSDAITGIENVVFNASDSEAVMEAVEALGERREDVMPQLRRVIREHPMMEARREAVETLAEMAVARGESAEREAAQVLERIVFDDRDGEVRMEAIDAIAELRNGIARPVLRRIASTHPDPEVREEARDALDN